jgi:hypothetical protein
MADKLHSLKAAARMVPSSLSRREGEGVCVETLMAWHRAGRLRLVKVGGRWFVPADELDRLLSAEGVAASGPDPESGAEAKEKLRALGVRC